MSITNLFELSHIRQIIDVCLTTATEALTIEQLALAFDNNVELSVIKTVMAQLEEEYKARGLELMCLNGAYRLRSQLEYQQYLSKVYKLKPAKYSRAVLETIAIIAYRQPITRNEIEDIRGVAVNSSIVQTLIERGWIEGVGHKEVPGKPELLATTSKFLADLGLSQLAELPALPNITQHDFPDTSNLIQPLEQYVE
jgi:segregation and condensation protein B